jgi:hypothetical protein
MRAMVVITSSSSGYQPWWGFELSRRVPCVGAGVWRRETGLGTPYGIRNLALVATV